MPRKAIADREKSARILSAAYLAHGPTLIEAMHREYRHTDPTYVEREDIPHTFQRMKDAIDRSLDALLEAQQDCQTARQAWRDYCALRPKNRERVLKDIQEGVDLFRSYARPDWAQQLLDADPKSDKTRHLHAWTFTCLGYYEEWMEDDFVIERPQLHEQLLNTYDRLLGTMLDLNSQRDDIRAMKWELQETKEALKQAMVLHDIGFLMVSHHLETTCRFVRRFDLMPRIKASVVRSGVLACVHHSHSDEPLH